MNFVHVLFLAIIGLISTTTALEKCELGTSWNEIFDYDCTRYYQCSNGILILKLCPRDQEFDPKLKICRKPLLLGCNNIFELDYQIDQLQRRPDCPNNQSQTILYPHETDCTKFYSCTNGILTIQDCAFGTEFDPEKGYCDWITEGGCSSRTTSNIVETTSPNIDLTTSATSQNPDISSSDPDLTTSHIDTTSSYPEYTTQYPDTPTPYPDTPTPDPDTPTPDPDTPTPYPDTPTPYPDTTTNPELTSSYPDMTTVRVICDDPNIVFVPHETDCEKYYFCLSGIPQQLQCPEGEEFDYEMQKCVLISDSGCFASQTTFKHNL